MTRFDPSVQGPFVHVCEHNLSWFHYAYFEIVFTLVLFFPLCCYGFFSVCTFKISGAFVLFVLFLHFVACSNMCRAKAIVCLFGCWFSFCVVMRIYLLGLDFGVFWGLALLCFPLKLVHFPPFLMFADSCRLGFFGLCGFFAIFVSFAFLRGGLVVCLLCFVFCLCVLMVFGCFLLIFTSPLFAAFCNVHNMLCALVSMLHFASLFVFLFFL